MSSYEIVNIFDMLDMIGEESLQSDLSCFSCEKNMEIENFVRFKAIDFAKRKSSITYLVIDEEGSILGIFTLTHKVISIVSPKLGKSAADRLKRYSQYDSENDTYTISAFLIAQFGKNYAVTDNRLSGNELMDCALGTLKSIQRSIGGGVVYLECEENIPKLREFYTNEHNRYIAFGRRESTDVNYLQLFRLL
ncbi:MAG: GNAT family acetyltransferase [Clostridia bacterium]|nr:GNAT family acetyltransferase [Clostridia bacterium]